MTSSLLFCLVLLASTIAAVTYSEAYVTSPVQCSSVRIAYVVALNGRPCKIFDISGTGSDEVHFDCIDVFTSQKLKGTCTNQIGRINDDYYKYALLGVSEDGSCAVRKNNGDVIHVLLPEGELGDNIRAAFKPNSKGYVTVISVPVVAKQVVVSYSEK